MTCAEVRLMIMMNDQDLVPPDTFDVVVKHLVDCKACWTFLTNQLHAGTIKPIYMPATDNDVQEMVDAGNYGPGSAVLLTPVKGHEMIGAMYPRATKTKCSSCGQECWTPPQALAILESGLPAVCIPCTPEQGVHVVSQEHINREARQAKAQKEN